MRYTNYSNTLSAIPTILMNPVYSKPNKPLYFTQPLPLSWEAIGVYDMLTKLAKYGEPLTRESLKKYSPDSYAVIDRAVAELVAEGYIDYMKQAEVC